LRSETDRNATRRRGQQLECSRRGSAGM